MKNNHDADKNMPSDPVPDPSISTALRRSYRKPEISELGNIKELTRTGGDASVEWGG